MAQKSNNKFLTYKGKPLVRCGNTLYYGKMTDKYVVMMQIQGTRKIKDLDISEKITLQLISTDTSLSPNKRVIKKSEKNGLYNAMDIATIWLERALEETESKN